MNIFLIFKLFVKSYFIKYYIMFSYLEINKMFLGAGMVLTILLSCGGNTVGDKSIIQPEEQEKIIPTNLSLSISIIGEDVKSPNGDGTGVITCVTTANNAIKYGFRFGSSTEVESSDGLATQTYTQKGTNIFIVYVYAYSSTGDYINTSEQITLFVAQDSFNTLVFSDEFDTDGSPDDSKWNYDIGTGSNGWGNAESQYYTKRAENVTIEEGLLKITAKREDYEGAEFTSTRMKTQDKFDFTYGRVDIRAKLPEGGGTWPALWMLGANISAVGWPACGEIDIMEHVGNNQGTVQSAMHTPSSYGNTSNHGSKYVADVSSEFHVYSVTWSNDEIVFRIDDVTHYRYHPSNKNTDTWPYTSNQFIILNVAMGGGFGGEIDEDFSESSMEIDFVRVYQ